MPLAILSMIAPAVFLVSCFNQPPIQEGLIIIAELLLIYGLLVGALFLFKPKTVGERTAKLNGRTIVSFVLVAALMGGYGYSIFSFQNELFTKSIPGSVTFINTGKVPEGMAGEIWLRCYQNGRQLSSEKLLESADQENWFEKDGFLVSTGEGDSMTITFDSLNNISFDFQRHPYCGSVKINYPGMEYQIELYSETGSIYSLNPKNNIPIEYHAGALSLLGILLTLTGIALYWFMISYEGYGWRLYYLLCFIPTVAIAWETNSLPQTYVIILILSLFVVLRWDKYFANIEMQKYFKKPIQIAICMVSMYFAFALVGDGLFLDESRMTLNYATVMYFCLVWVTLSPLVYLGVFLFEKSLRWIQANKKQEGQNHHVRVRIVSFLLAFCIELVLCYGFYPANMSQDSITHWSQAIGVSPFTDDNPVIFVLLIRGLSRIIPSPFSFVLFQVFLFSWLLSDCCGFIYSKGAKEKALYVLTFCAAILPSNYMMLSYLSKNPMCGIINCWAMLLLIRLLDDPVSVFNNLEWHVKATLVFAAIYLLRFNNIPAFYTIGVIVGVYGVIYFRKTGGKSWRPVGVWLLSFVLIQIIQGPLYSQLEIVNIELKPYVTLFTPVEKASVEKIELPEEIERIKNQVLPEEEWGNRYNPYHSDTFAWGVPNPDYSGLGFADVLKMYLKMLVEYPDIVIQDRLNGCESIWNIFPSKGHGAYNQRAYIGVLVPVRDYIDIREGENLSSDPAYYYVENSISKFATALYDYSAQNEVIDLFVWRSGIWIIGLMILCIVLLVNNMGRMICAILPSIMILCTLFLAVGWQIFAYQYFFPIAVRWFIICMLFLLPARTQPLPETTEA